MKVKQTRLKCAVNGCRNRDTFYVSRSGVYFNSPNICKECAKLAYEALFAEEIKAEAKKAKKAEVATVSEKETVVAELSGKIGQLETERNQLLEKIEML